MLFRHQPVDTDHPICFAVGRTQIAKQKMVGMAVEVIGLKRLVVINRGAIPAQFRNKDRVSQLLRRPDVVIRPCQGDLKLGRSL
jgi:hypothetical protein